MEIGLSNTLLAGDPRLVDHIVGEVKSQGIFDQFRKECIADVDTKPAYQNLRTRVEGSVNSFLSKQTWKPDLNKNQLRENLRKHIHEAAYLDAGVERIVDQVVNPKVYSVFMPQIEDVVYKFLGLERPKGLERNGAHGLRDLLPKDLDPVSPESDKNSLKDVSLESVDANNDENSVANDEKQSSTIRNNEQQSQSDDNCIEKPKDDHSNDEQPDAEKKQLEASQKSANKNVVPSSNLNTTSKSDDKVEEEEEDSPVFEPIDIMNLNESNVSNDSHLSGISELSSHRSRSPTFSNDFSKDNMDFSNPDSQLSKVSSDSRLSIVTDFGLSNLSNHASTPVLESSKDDSNKGKSKESSDSKYPKDNFKAIREFESGKNNVKETKTTLDPTTSKDNVQEIKDTKDSKNSKSGLPSKESSRDATDTEAKEKNDSRDSKDKSKDSDSSKVKSIKDKPDSRDFRSHKDRDKDHKKRQNSHSSSRNDKNDKYHKDKSKERSDKLRESSEKPRESLDKSKENCEKSKEDKVKDSDRKVSAGKESKDLKDIYKEKIRELREKKELTEKEKLHKDNKESKMSKETKDRKDRKDYKKEHKTSSSKNTTRHEEKMSKTEEKSATKSETGKPVSKGGDSKDSKGEVKDSKGEVKDSKGEAKDSKGEVKDSKGEAKDSKGEVKDSKGEVKDSKGEPKDKRKRDDRRHSKEIKNRSHSTTKCDTSDKHEKSDAKKDTKSDSHSKDSERNDKLDGKKESKTDGQRLDGRKDSKTDSQSKNVEKPEKSDGRKDAKTDVQGKDKKRKDEKKSKAKDDHSSLRKNPNDRRSTDRDGSNGSNGKSSQKSSASSSTCSTSVVSSNLTKESSGTSNSSSETSDNIEGSQADELKPLPSESTIGAHQEQPGIEASTSEIIDENTPDSGTCVMTEFSPKKVELGQTELSLPLKKRPLLPECTAPSPNDFKVKKPKFAKNFYEAKKLIKIRKRLEKQRMRDYEAAKEKFRIFNAETNVKSPPTTVNDENSIVVVDEDRVQIIEIPDDEYDQPYPEKSTDLTEESSTALLDKQLIINTVNQSQENPERQSKLSEMENSIRQSLEEMICDKKLAETNCPTASTENPGDSKTITNTEAEAIVVQNNSAQNKDSQSASVLENKNTTESIDAIQHTDVHSAKPASVRSNVGAATLENQEINEPALGNEKSRDSSMENEYAHKSSFETQTLDDSRKGNCETKLFMKQNRFNEDSSTVTVNPSQNTDITIPAEETEASKRKVLLPIKSKDAKKLNASKKNAPNPKALKFAEHAEKMGTENAALSDRCTGATVIPPENPSTTISSEKMQASKCEALHPTTSKDSKKLKVSKKNTPIPKALKSAERIETMGTENAALSDRCTGATVIPSENPGTTVPSEEMQTSKCKALHPTTSKDSKKLKASKKNTPIPKALKSAERTETMGTENAALSDRCTGATVIPSENHGATVPSEEMQVSKCKALHPTTPKDSKKLNALRKNTLIPKAPKFVEPEEPIDTENAVLSNRCPVATVIPQKNPDIALPSEETQASKREVSHIIKLKDSKKLRAFRKNAVTPEVLKSTESTETIDTEDATLSDRCKGAAMISPENPDKTIRSEVMQALKRELSQPTKSKDSKKLKTLRKNARILKVTKSAEPDTENATLSACCASATESSAQVGTGSVDDQKRDTDVPAITTEDQDDCLYLDANSEESSRFSKFLEDYEIEQGKTMDVIIESLGGQLVQPLPKTMAPPLPKHKLSTSPLTDIFLNNSNNNNDGHKIVQSLNEEGLKVIKKRKLGRPKKQRGNANVCASHNLPNGENFVMPLSPESDVSATSEKTTLHTIKEEKGRQRSNQRYSSDDLYKPRPFFSSSSRRSRRSTQA